MVKYRHLRGGFGQSPGFTVASEIVENNIEFGVAICSKNDNYCKKTGRILAEERLKEDPILSIPIDDPKNIKTIFKWGKFLAIDLTKQKLIGNYKKTKEEQLEV